MKKFSEFYEDIFLEAEIGSNNFINKSKLMEYYNECCEDIYRSIIVNNPEYFLARVDIPVVGDCKLPKDIYAAKIRKVLIDGRPVKNISIDQIHNQRREGQGYIIYMKDGEYVMEFHRPYKSNKIAEIYYIRKYEYIPPRDICTAYIKYKCFSRKHSPILKTAYEDYVTKKNLYLKSLENMIPDGTIQFSEEEEE